MRCHCHKGRKRITLWVSLFADCAAACALPLSFAHRTRIVPPRHATHSSPHGLLDVSGGLARDFLAGIAARAVQPGVVRVADVSLPEVRLGTAAVLDRLRDDILPRLTSGGGHATSASSRVAEPLQRWRRTTVGADLPPIQRAIEAGLAAVRAVSRHRQRSGRVGRIGSLCSVADLLPSVPSSSRSAPD